MKKIITVLSICLASSVFANTQPQKSHSFSEKTFSKAELNAAWDRPEDASFDSINFKAKTFSKAELNAAWDRPEDASFDSINFKAKTFSKAELNAALNRSED